MTITGTSKELTAQEIYLMTKSPSIKTVNSVTDGDTLAIYAHLTFEDTNAKGQASDLLSLMGTDSTGETVVWTCQSETFKRNFRDLAEIFGEEPFTIVKISGVTKAGKDFVNCDLYH